MLKRDIRLFLRCLAPAAVLTAVFAAACAVAALAVLQGSADVYTPVKAAVVDSENSVLSRMLIHGVAKTDYISRLMDIDTCNMDTAMEGLETGEFAAVIILPEGFLGDITSGTQASGRILLSSSAALHADVVAGAAHFGELMLAAGQYGVFSGEALIRQHELDDTFHNEFLVTANALLLGEAIDAGNDYFTIETLPYADTGMSSASYYAMSWLTLLLMLSCMFFSHLYTSDLNRPILCRLRGAGVTDTAFLAGKLLLPFLFILIILATVLLSLTRFLPMEFSIRSLPAAVLCAAMISCIGAAVSTCLTRGSGAIAVIAVLGLFLCGGIVPRQMLPSFVLTIGSLTPFGAAHGLLFPAFGGQLPVYRTAVALFWLVLSLGVLPLRLRQLRLGGDPSCD